MTTSSACATDRPAAGWSRVRLGVWLFIASDALTFAALFFGYAYLRNASAAWPRPFEFGAAIVPALVMTLVLFGSGLAMSLAARRAEAGAFGLAARWLGIACGAGLLFLVLHLAEWRALFDHGMTLRANPWGEPLFGSTFYALTGFHMLHVLGGVVVLAALARRASTGRASSEGISAFGIYWHFVEIVWLFLFPLVYLLSLGGGA